MNAPCAIKTCPCLVAPGSRYCRAHAGGWKAEADAPQTCPHCGRKIKRGQLVSIHELTDRPAHVSCLSAVL